MTGLKWPPHVGAQAIIANAIPIAKAYPMWKMDPKAVNPIGLAVFNMRAVTEAIPGS